MRSLWIAIALGACGKGGDPPRDDRPPAAAAAPAPPAGPAALPPDAPPAPPDAREAPFARASSPELRALGAALDDVDDRATRDWIDRTSRRPPDVPADELAPDPMPPATAQAIDALVAWHASGAPIRIECASPELAALLPLLDTAKAAIAATTAPD